MTKQAASSSVEEHYRKAATQLWSDNELEIDSDATVSASDGGAWVHAWVWVSNDGPAF